jgi:hypothetical protein
MSTATPSKFYKRLETEADDIVEGGIEGYVVNQPIRISYEEISDSEVQARFAEANFAVSGTSRQDAFQALTEEILTAFDDWSADESKLGPGPRQQLAILRKYLGKGTP